MSKFTSQRPSSALDRLTKSKLSETDRVQLKNRNGVIQETKSRLNGICKSLLFPTNEYKASITVESISHFLESSNRLPRILYSHFSNYIFSLRDEQRGIFDTNVENLLQYVTNNNVNEEIKEFAIRIYDHCQLAKAQIENIDHMLEERIATAQDQITGEAKKLEKEYISILGIFASVVLSFTAGIVFSSSVLDNIANASPYRTVCICVLIGLVLMNLLFVLFHFIGVLVHEKAEMKKWPMLLANGVLIAILIALFGFWHSGCVEKRNQAIESELVKRSSISETVSSTLPTDLESFVPSTGSSEIAQPPASPPASTRRDADSLCNTANVD